MNELGSARLVNDRGLSSAGGVPGAAPLTVLRLLVCIAIGGVIAAILSRILSLNDGMLVYTLDDPYIHLAMSEEIFRGGYGVNSGEPSAASSSILYPALLALGAWSDHHAYLPLAINLLALFGSINIAIGLLARLGFCDTRGGQLISGVGLLLFTLATNQIGVVFTGMEHSLHILVILSITLGLIILAEEGRVPWWLIAAIVLNPLIRYEGLAASIGAAGLLLWRRQYAAAVIAGGACALTLGGFSTFLVSLDLSPLPSSVLVKSRLSNGGVDGEGAGFLGNMVANLLHNLSLPQGIIIALLCLLILCRPISTWRRQELPMMLFLLFIAAGHLLAGQFTWSGRYELYLLTAMLVGSLYVWRKPSLAGTRGACSLAAAMATMLLCLERLYLPGTWQVPTAANNIYEQQYQMHRFVTEFYRQPVAINDLGWVSYRNADYVLDLWGLGSETVRRESAGGRSKALLDGLVRQHGVGLALVYEDWFGDAIPDGWMLVAELHLSRQRITPSRSRVSFFSTDPRTTAHTLALLHRFKATLPPGVRLDIYDHAGGG